jgi:hypothetical protein
MLRLQITIIEDISLIEEPELNGYSLHKLQETSLTFDSKFGNPVHVNPAVHAMLTGSANNLKRGKLEDVPFCDVEDNHTVKVIGSFVQSKSHLPNDHYSVSPFSRIVSDIIPIDKAPCVYDITKIPDEIKDTLVKNRYGEPCQRSTLSLKWAHKNHTNRIDLKEISKEFAIKIKTYYSGLRILTDEEVLGGITEGKMAGYVKGMELDTSIGFLMKELFYTSKKSDVIGKNENGTYYWHDNPAANFLRAEYLRAKNLSGEGKKYCAIFTELLKMEKLKIEGGKNYKGRTFVAQDILGVLMERRNLGMLTARAYKNDPNCGIGIDPVKTFNQVYCRLNKHPNLWAGDYSNFDRNTPGAVQEEITDLLATANPHMANEIKSTMATNIQRIQVSGCTLFEVF